MEIDNRHGWEEEIVNNGVDIPDVRWAKCEYCEEDALFMGREEDILMDMLPKGSSQLKLLCMPHAESWSGYPVMFALVPALHQRSKE